MAVVLYDVASTPPPQGVASVAEVIATKRRAEARIMPEAGFPAMWGQHYLDRLAALHAARRPAAYLEIGAENGASLSLASGAVIAVDPDMRLAPGALVRAQEVHLFRQTSDEFFAGGFLGRAKISVDMAFLDGLHHFDALLRDIANAERRMSPDGVILLHDCAPMSRAAARRDWDRAETPFWCGDVWKVLPILREHRPDLDIALFPAAPSGLVALTGLNPRSTLLNRRHDAIADAWRDVTIDEFGLEAFSALVAELTARPADDIQQNDPGRAPAQTPQQEA